MSQQSPKHQQSTREWKPEIVHKPIDSIKPNPNQTRKHSRSQIAKLKRSIEVFDVVLPVLIDIHSTIVHGHGLWIAAKDLGRKDIATICIDHLTPDQIRLLAIALNRAAEDGEWDSDKLKSEFQYLLSVPDLDVSLTGFEIAEVDILLLDHSTGEDPADQVSAVAPTAVTQFGDLWLLGDEHRLFCGDARMPSDYEKLLDGRKGQIAFTDPPFNQSIRGHVSGNGRTQHREFPMASGEMTRPEYQEFLTTCLGNLAHATEPGSVHYVVMDWPHVLQLLLAAERVYDGLLNLCVWNKDRGGMGSLYRGQHELVGVFKAGKGTPRNNVQLGRFGRNRTNVWSYPCAATMSQKPGEEDLLSMHPTSKPIALVADALLDCSARGDTVIDPFVGSGTTLLAAERVGRSCCALELDPLYVDLAIRRWQQMTGENAGHAQTGETFNAKSTEVLHDR